MNAVFAFKSIAIAALVSLGLMAASPAKAHHGWAWTTGKNVELTGVITSTNLGNPHGEITVKVGDTEWTAEVGQPWRNERAGLKKGDLAEGVEVTLIGEPSADPKEKLVKVERLKIGDKDYILYPGRD